MKGSSYCYWHDPATEEERLAGLVGAERPRGAPILPEGEALCLERPEDIEALLRQTVRYLATAPRVEPKRANAVIAACNQLLKVMNIRELQAEIAALRAENSRLQRVCAAQEQRAEELAVRRAG
jgi:uncharacterized small protein (DUF1192 family)